VIAEIAVSIAVRLAVCVAKPGPMEGKRCAVVGYRSEDISKSYNWDNNLIFCALG
jgi:hypothetical protein